MLWLTVILVKKILKIYIQLTASIYQINLKKSDVKSNIILHVDFNKHIPEPTGTDEGKICYIVIISKSLHFYEQNKNKIIDKIN